MENTLQFQAKRTGIVNHVLSLIIHQVIPVAEVDEVNVWVNVNSCRVVVAVRSAEVHVATPFWYIINLKLDVPVDTLTNALTIYTWLANQDHVTEVFIWDTQLVAHNHIVRVSAVVVPSGATVVLAVTVVFVLVHEALLKSLLLVIYWVLYWRLSGI